VNHDDLNSRTCGHCKARSARGTLSHCKSARGPLAVSALPGACPCGELRGSRRALRPRRHVPLWPFNRPPLRRPLLARRAVAAFTCGASTSTVSEYRRTHTPKETMRCALYREASCFYRAEIRHWRQPSQHERGGALDRRSRHRFAHPNKDSDVAEPVTSTGRDARLRVRPHLLLRPWQRPQQCMA
jgi:hypothetical protein